MGKGSILLATGEEELKDRYEELRDRLDAAALTCNMEELEEIRDSAEFWARYFWTHYPELAAISNPFWDIAAEAEDYIIACITPEGCDDIGCTSEWDWPWLHRVVNNVQCHGAKVIIDDLEETIKQMVAYHCPMTCIRREQRKLEYIKDFYENNCVSGEPPEPELRADFDFKVHKGRTRYRVEFYDVSSHPRGDPIAKRKWDFGDGHTGWAISPTHYYYESGDYDVTLQIWTESGATDAVTKTVPCHGLEER